MQFKKFISCIDHEIPTSECFLQGKFASNKTAVLIESTCISVDVWDWTEDKSANVIVNNLPLADLALTITRIYYNTEEPPQYIRNYIPTS